MNRNNREKISIIGPSTRFLSGISYYTIRLCNALSENLDVHAVLFRNMLPKRLFPGWKRVGTRVVLNGFRDSIHVAEILDWYNPLSWAAAARIIRNTDTLILEWWTSSVVHMYLALLLLCRNRCRFVIEFHEVVDPLESAILPLRIYTQIAGRIMRKASSLFIVHSNHDRMLISDHYHISPERIRVIPHGLYDQYPILEKRGCQEKLGTGGMFVILFFGLLRPYKGVSCLIRAFESLPEAVWNNSVLLIAGEAWEDCDSLALLGSSPAKANIRHYNEYIADEEIPLFFSAADILVLPYTRASQSGVAHIGISYGIPIIASRVGGLVEGLGTYAGTRFISASDCDELREAIEAEYSCRPRGRIEPPDDLRWERIAEKFLLELDMD
ncbi:MAG: glycosyltransferase [Methanospirillum sp.]|nr:glycosyltransferase [Methanospirillum sp.]